MGVTATNAIRAASARAAIFVDPPAAIRALDAVMASAEAEWQGKNDELTALYSLRGRASLMAGDPKTARQWFQRALKASGGLTPAKVSIADVRVRGDLALAAWQAGDRDDARKYLAYTGAGSLPEKGFEFGADTPLPECGVGGLRPDDMAVVELAIAEDGRVARAQTVYATRLGGPEALFARAARGWSWTPEATAKLPAWWRSAVRLEMRCVTGRQNGVPMAAVGDLPGWLAGKGVAPFAPSGSDAAILPSLRAEAARREGLGGLPPVPVLVAIGGNAVAPDLERAAAWSRASELLAAAGAPMDLVTSLAANAVVAIRPSSSSKQEFRRSSAATAARLDALIAERRAAGTLGGRGGAYALLMLGAARAAADDRAGATEAYRRIAAMPETALPAASLLRQRALLQLASAEAAAKRPDEAARLYALTGLQPGQCALLDAPPKLRRAAVGSNDFPTEARLWQFEGFARLSFDIAADGGVERVRTVLASPPLVFSEGSAETARRFRFEPVFRPGGEQGCAGATQTMRYKIGGR